MYKNILYVNLVAISFLAIGVLLHFFVPIKGQIGSDLFLFLAVMVHSGYLFGIERTIKYALFAMILGYGSEVVGIQTGLIFGTYHYNDAANMLVVMGVPVGIALMYVVYLYVGSFIMIGISHRLIWAKNLWILALMTGFLLTYKEMSTDALQSTVYHVWSWTNGGEYFGVPIHNFIGWFILFVIMNLVTAYFTWHKNNYADTIMINRKVIILPWLVFLAIGVFAVSTAFQVPDQYRDLGNVAAFTAGFLLTPYLLLSWFNSILHG